MSIDIQATAPGPPIFSSRPPPASRLRVSPPPVTTLIPSPPTEANRPRRDRALFPSVRPSVCRRTVANVDLRGVPTAAAPTGIRGRLLLAQPARLFQGAQNRFRETDPVIIKRILKRLECLMERVSIANGLLAVVFVEFERNGCSRKT
ncbi:unnamed protein product [Acanthoscelides obtectus]|uniref:Uncharacterized protein n=1 Tax=Acanthoscelides obtectus TaxID=200917 RepID=A0A9P0KMP0_ACAOB|nr:unnamed protein product [Acanthoscelides obtectus]CAK1669221.1 hypothetical protein AOBTE_LOCUS26879 [Acanthoscelides obtectus]